MMGKKKSACVQCTHLLVGLCLAFGTLVLGCDRLPGPLAPKRNNVAAFTPGWQVAAESLPKIGAVASPNDRAAPQTDDSTFRFTDAGSDDRGWLKFNVTIQPGGSPAGVAETKFTPLFSVDGKDPIRYVTDAFFQSNPNRRVTTIQPGDSFDLALPPDTFVVQSRVEQQDAISRARYAEYISDHDDALRYYLTDPFPILFEIASGAAASQWTIHLHPELSNLARTGRTDPIRLAQLIYRVPDPDLLQVESARQLLADDAPRTIVVDRARSHLDVGRQFDDLAIQTERVAELGLQHLTRRVFPPDQGVPFMAVEDATQVDDTRQGTVVRVEYAWDGTVRLVYRTGSEDTKGKRDPYQLRENERWATLYKLYGDSANAQPVKWGEGVPSDYPPFPSARDPYQHGDSYNFLIAGRYLVLAFQPARFGEVQPGDVDMSSMLESIRGRYGKEIGSLLSLTDGLRAR
jgi:hypothetical protein